MNAMPGSNIYEVNLRQYTDKGTIEAFITHLPRLKNMGVDILWFMPIHPISVEKRKQGLGSYYSVADYKGLNSEFGSKADFDRMVKKIHELGMFIIIDWVPNHTGWDHPWIKLIQNGIPKIKREILLIQLILKQEFLGDGRM